MSRSSAIHAAWVQFSTLTCLIIAGVFLIPQDAVAVPGFARQTGTTCSTCHYQHFPALNAFGRAFKEAGYTMSGEQGRIEADNLSIPVTLNASLLTKIRYQKTNGSTSETDTGELQFPDEAALVIGGRGGEHLGFLLEFGTFGTADTGTGTVTGGTADTGSGDFSLFNSFKAHYNYQIDGINYGAVVFSTDTGGASYGFELLNTGAQRFMRVAEDRQATSAQQFVGLGSGTAEGFAFVASGEQGFVNLSLWTPNHGNAAVNGPATYLRGAWTPMLGSWDMGVGFQYFGGTASRSVASGSDVDTKGWAVDGQAQGTVADKPVGFYVTYATADASATNVFNTGPNQKKAWSVTGEWGILPDKATLLLGYLDGDNGAVAGSNKDQRLMIGATWMLAQNAQLMLWNTSYSGNKYDPKPVSGGDNLTSLMLFVGF
jgi:hypothetical protein